MRKPAIVLLSLTAVLNLLFWLMIASGYSLSWQSKLVGLPATAEYWVFDWYRPLTIPQSQYGGLYATTIVGSIAVISLAALIVKVRRQNSPAIARGSSSRSEARTSLVLLPVFLMFFALLVPLFGNGSINWYLFLLQVGYVMALLHD